MQRLGALAEYNTGKQVSDQSRPFWFFDNRQEYLSCVTTCNEKSKVAERAIRELDKIVPVPSTLRIFDAEVGGGTLLSHVLRSSLRQFSVSANLRAR